MRSTRMSRWSSPIPLMMVWPVSRFCSVRKVGSSSASFWIAMPELVLVGLGLRLDRDLDDRGRERHRLEDDLVGRVGQGVTGGGVLQTDDRVDVTGGDAVDRVLLVGVHLEDLPDALLLALGRVDDLAAALDVTGVDPDVGEATEERVHGDLERERGERLRRVGVAEDDLLLVARVVGLDGRHVERAGQVVHDRVEHRLHAAVLERRAAEHRVDLAVDGELADGALDLGDRQLLAGEVLLEQRVVGLGDGLEQDRAGTRSPSRRGPRGSPRWRTWRRARRHPWSRRAT